MKRREHKREKEGRTIQKEERINTVEKSYPPPFHPVTGVPTTVIFLFPP